MLERSERRRGEIFKESKLRVKRGREERDRKERVKEKRVRIDKENERVRARRLIKGRVWVGGRKID